MSFTTYKSPGVYYQTVDVSEPTELGIRTDIAGFVGIAERGPIDTAVPVESWRQFEACFGGFTSVGYLAYSVRSFFENGGRRCWVVRVASKDEVAGVSTSFVRLLSNSGTTTSWIVNATSPGSWGNALSVRCVMTNRIQLNGEISRDNRKQVYLPNVSGLQRGTLLRIRSNNDHGMTVLAVVSSVDAARGFALLSKIGSGIPIEMGDTVQLESIEYTLSVFERGNVVGVYEGLSIIPEHHKYGPRVLSSGMALQSTGTGGPLTGMGGQSTTMGVQSRSVGVPSNRVSIVENRVKFLEGIYETVSQNDLILNSDAQLSGGRNGLSTLAVEDFVGFDTSPDQTDFVKELGKRGIRVLNTIYEVSVLAMPDIHIQPTPVRSHSVIEKKKDPCALSCDCNGSNSDDGSIYSSESLASYESPKSLSLSASQEPFKGFSLDEIFQAQSELVAICERSGDKFALLDPPYLTTKESGESTSLIESWRARFDTHSAALFYPWCRVVNPIGSVGASLLEIPVSGYVAGQIADIDRATGPHKAPANIPLSWVQDVNYLTSDTQHSILNEKSINVLTSSLGRSIRVMGARTLSNGFDWRYISVRRLMLMIKRAVNASTQWAVFEPNNPNTRVKIQMAISNYMQALWSKGAFAGNSESEAFFVKCDAENNSGTERENGRLKVEIGFAPAVPLEFIVLRVYRTENELEIHEHGPENGNQTWA